MVDKGTGQENIVVDDDEEFPYCGREGDIEEPPEDEEDLPETLELSPVPENTSEDSLDSRIEVVKNPALESFLKRCDRDLPPDRRCYGIKLCFAGCESKAVRDGLYRIGVRQILVSYFYFRKYLKRTSLQELAEDLGRFDFVFLDSGGFTLMQALQKNKATENLKDYAEEYYRELPKIHHLFSICAEVDVEELGIAYMEEKKRQMLDAGVNIAPVIQQKPISQYESYGWFDLFPYIALGSITASDPKYVSYINQLYEIGKEKGIVYHGFGVTRANTILRSRYYSVDSTSWTSGARFGVTMIFQNGRIRHYDKKKKDVRKRYKRRFEEAGLIWSDLEQDKNFEINMMNALAWKQWADYIKYSAHKCYWLTPKEWDEALTMKSKAFNAEGLMDRSASIQRTMSRRLAQVDDARKDDRTQEPLLCNNCNMSGRCPRYKPEQPCGYDINIRLETQADLKRAIQIVLESQLGRVNTGILFEKLEGGTFDMNLSLEVQRFMNMVAQAKSIFEIRDDEIEIKAKGGGAVSKMMEALFKDSDSKKEKGPVINITKED